MPMGFRNAPAIFQRHMDRVLEDEIGKSCFVYVDDILIFSKGEEEHEAVFKNIIDILNKNHLEINNEKTIYKQEKVEFLGHIITYNKVYPKNSVSQGIDDTDIPHDRKQLQEFLGFINYYRKFVKGCAMLGAPLYDLLQEKKKYIWDEAAMKAFEALKEELKKKIELNQPDFNKPFQLETDASNHGIGAILSQTNEKEKYPMAFASRRLKEHEKKYSISEKEFSSNPMGT
jgi:hypothetical protein